MGSVKLMRASAGSGKTFMLAYEYVSAVVREPGSYSQILAVTFTNKATEEMKRRIVAEINDLANGQHTQYMSMLADETGLDPGIIAARAKKARTNILHDYSHFSVLTIDKFFQRIIRSFVKELGIDLNFSLELKTESLLAGAADLLIDDISLDESLRQWISAFVEERIAEGRGWDIRKSLTDTGRQIFSENARRNANVTARDELGRIVEAAQKKVDVVKETMKSDALRAIEIMDSNGLLAGDFKRGSISAPAYFAKVASGEIAEPNSYVLKALADEGEWAAKTSPQKGVATAAVPQLRALLDNIISQYNANRKLIGSLELLRANYRNFALLTDLSEKVYALSRAENIMPIAETNTIISKLVSGNDTPFIYEKVGNHFRRFMIDEFQDTSSMQWENFIPLLRNALSQAEDSPVLLVGDVKQSIYRWRGSDWRILASEIGNEFAGLIDIGLNDNYRSERRIVEFNNAMIESCVGIDNEALDAELASAREKGELDAATASELTGLLARAYHNHAQQAQKEGDRGYITVTHYRAEEEGGEPIPPVIARIEDLQRRGYAPGDIVILVRARREGYKIARMLLDRKGANPQSGFCYDVVTDEALSINSSPVTGFVLAAMKLAVDPRDGMSLAVYNRWLGRDFTAPLPVGEEEFLAAAGLMPPEEAFEAIQARYELGRPNEVAYLQAFQQQLMSFSNSTVSDLDLFLKWWDENSGEFSVNVPPGRNAISIMTIHKAKGLEYKAVLIPYCNWPLNPMARSTVWSAPEEGSEISGTGAVPVGFNKKMAQSYFSADYYKEMVMSHVDNINTLYVAVTRAKEELHLMIPEKARKTSGLVSNLIEESLKKSDGKVLLGGLKGNLREDQLYTTAEFGKPAKNTVEEDLSREEILHLPYSSYPIGERLKLKLRNLRYYNDKEGEPSPFAVRDYGILMHSAFEQAAGIEDIRKAIEGMLLSGSVTAEEAAELQRTIAKAFENDTIRSWFAPGWEQMRIENSIIIPGNPSPRRPDRVMIKGRQAVVVDYKFGSLRPASHTRQVRNYMSLLRQMGYSEIKGYLWYVSLNEVDEVSLFENSSREQTLF